VWWHTTAFQALRRLRKKNLEFKASLGYMRLCLSKKKFDLPLYIRIHHKQIKDVTVFKNCETNIRK
jgi:hypothetical protein